MPTRTKPPPQAWCAASKACGISTRNYVASVAVSTLKSPKLAGDGRAAAAEFNLSPLLQELGNNRPLRLELPGVFTELPVPPYVVAEWRSLPTWKEGDEQR